MSQKFATNIHNEIAQLKKIPELLDRFQQQHALNSRTIFHLNLAIEEIITNSILHGSRDNETHSISLSLTLENKSMIVVTIEDEGVPFDPLGHPEPELHLEIEDRPEGNLGIHLVRQLMDEIDYTHREGKNIIVMKKIPVEKA